MESKLIKGIHTQVPLNRDFNNQKRMLHFLTNAICLSFIVILIQQKAIGQNLGINTTGALPDSSAMLDIISPNKGLLIPRVSLTSTTDTITIGDPATSLLVYNTNASITGGSGLGYYYYNGSLWVNFVSGSSSSNYVQNQVASDQAAGLRITGNGLFNGGQVTIGTATPSSGYLLTMNTSSGVSKGLDIAMSGGSGTGVNVTSSSSAHNGILVSNSSSSVSASFNGIGSVLSSTNIVSGYSGFRNSSGLSYGIYGINGTNATYATNASTWAAFLRGRTVISSETSPSSGLGTDLEIRNTTTGAGNPATVSMRQGTSNTTNATVLANLNFGDNHQTGPQAQIQITRGAAGGASDLPTDMIFSTTPDASVTLTERMRILNNGNVGIGTTSPTAHLHVYSQTAGVNDQLAKFENYSSGTTGSAYISVISGTRSFDFEQNSGGGSPYRYGTYVDANIVNNYAGSSGAYGNINFVTGNAGGSAIAMTIGGGTQKGNVGIGTTSPSAKFHVLSTTEQSRFGYDDSNYYSTTVASTGGVIFDAVGTGSAFTFSDAVNLPSASVGVTQALNDSTTKLATTAFVDRALSGVSGGSGWGLTGTSGTVDGTNFIGTTDNIPFSIKVNNQKAGRIDQTLNNAFWGYQAANSNTTGSQNTATGHYALKANTTGGTNTAIGYQAMNSNTTGANNVAVGADAMLRYGFGSRNIAIGYQSMYGSATLANNTGYDNVAIGWQAMVDISTGAYNIAVGQSALRGTTTGNYNIGIGVSSLYSNTTGSYNVSTGQGSLQTNTTGSENTAFGFQALASNSTGSYSVAIGVNSLYSSSAGLNTAIGYRTCESLTTGTYNTLVGDYAGAILTTGTYNTYLGSSSNGSSASLTNSTAVGASALVNASNKVRIGNSSVTVIEGQVAFTNVSDGRFKKNVSEVDVKGLPFIMRLRPVAYNIDTKEFEEFLTKSQPDSVKVKHFKNRDFTASTAMRHNGFIAQEVEQAAQATNYDFTGIHKPESADDNYGLAYSEFVVPLVKAMQEQQKIIDDLKLEIDKLKVEVSKIPK